MKYGLDIETTGKDPMTDKIVSIQVWSEKSGGLFFDFRIAQEREAAIFILKNPENEFVPFNGAMYDLLMIYRETGILVQPVGDAFTLALMAQEKEANLAYLVRKWLKEKKDSLEEITDGTFNFDREITERARQYGIDDARFALQLEAKMHKHYAKLDRAYAVELAVIPVLIKMRVKGLRIDPGLFGLKMTELKQKAGSLHRAMAKEVNSDFRPNSRADLIPLMFGSNSPLNLPMPPDRTSKGEPALNKDNLKWLVDHSSWASQLIELKHLYSVLSSGEKYTDLVECGYLHPEFRPLNWSGSARIYTTKPAVNQFPRELREAIIPDEGKKFAYLDWAAAELILLAYEAGQQDLLDIYNTGGDVHSYVTAEILDMVIEDVTEDLREISKIVTFSIVYGSMGGAASRALKVSFEEGKAYREKFLLRFKKIAIHIRNMISRAHRTCSVRTFLGRRRILHKIKSRNKAVVEEGERQAINTPIQNGVADLQKIALKRFHQILPEGYRVVFSVFDSFLIEFPDEDDPRQLEQMAKRVFHFKSGDFDLTMKFKMKVGYSFGKLQAK